LDEDVLYAQEFLVKPYYFGIYKTVQKPGYLSAEKNFEKRLAALIAFLHTLTFNDKSALLQVEKIKSFQISAARSLVL
jgi:hypothetical protein